MLHNECFDAFGSEAAEPLAATDACSEGNQSVLVIVLNGLFLNAQVWQVREKRAEERKYK